MENKFMETYKHQLKFGCKRQNCSKIFCKTSFRDDLLEPVANILALYGNEFVCENISKIPSPTREVRDRGFWCTDLLFFYLERHQLADSSTSIKSLGEATPYITNLETNKPSSLENKVKEINLKKDPETPHKFCRYFNKQNISPEEEIVLVGVTGILLKKYDKTQNYSLGLLIVRIINLLKKQNNFSVQQLSVIYKIYFNIHLASVNHKAKKNTGLLISRVCSEKCFDFIQEENNNSSAGGESVMVEGGNSSVLFEPFVQRPETNQSIVIPPHNVTIYTEFDIPVVPQEVVEESLVGQNMTEDSFVVDSKTCDECFDNIVVQKNLKYCCLDVPGFSKQDLVRSVSLISSYLNSIVPVDIRENKKVESLLNVFHLLYLINEKELVLNYKRFYLPQFCSKINFREEFKFYRAKAKTPLNFTFILPVYIKAELIKAETNDLMKASLQDSFFRALFEGHIGPYLVVTVNRENIYRESLDIIGRLGIEDVRKQLRITFTNEEGVDSGGIRKEFFQLLSHEIKHDDRLFTTKENSVWFRNDCVDLPSYIAIGRILGIALYNNVVLNIPFPSIFFKKLLNKKTTFNDLREIEPELYVSLNNLKRLTDEEIKELRLSFTITYISSKGTPKLYNLNNDKCEKLVTKDNVNSFVNRYADFYINRIIYRQFEAVRKGFYFVLERDSLIYLDHKELENIIMGSNDFDIHAFRSTASYSGYSPESNIIIWFWEIFESFERRMRKRLLQFITGNDRIPVAGAASLKLVIMKNGCDTDRLPSSQTCFNTLLLPEYSTKEKFEAKLNTALEMTAGFYLL